MLEELPNFDKPFLPILDKAFRDHADRVCLTFEDESYTYREVGEQSAQVANRLISLGFEPGMKGAIYSLNAARSFIVTLGLLRAGGTWIPVNPRNSAKDNIAVLNQFGADAIFYQRDFKAPVETFVGSAGGAMAMACLDGIDGDIPDIHSWTGDASTESPVVEVTPDHLVCIPLTGGTTGLPKGVMLSNRNFNALEFGTRHMNDGRIPTILCAAPMTHVGGRMAVCGLSSGTRFVILEQVDPQLILRTIEQEKITDFFLPPTGIYSLLDQPNIHDTDLSSLHSVSYGSAPISIPRLREALQVIGPVMRGGFGQTECPMFIARKQPEEHFVNQDITSDIVSDEKLRSVGRETALSIIGIVDDDGNPVPTGERGEIAVKGPMVSEGYYQSPDETAKIRVNGWHLTGDIGFLDEEGYLYVVDRKKDMIITGGFNVYSTEVEQSLMKQAGVKLATVIGVPDEKWGETVAAFIVKEEGSTLSEDDVIVQAKADLGGVKAPKQVIFVDDVPRTPVGKIDKKALRAEKWADAGRTI